MLPDTLVTQLHRLKLKGLMETLEIRLQQAEQDHLPAAEFLQLAFQDEITRRDAQCLKKRLQSAQFESNYTFDNMILDHYASPVKRLIRELQTGRYCQEGKGIIIMGPTGTGKTHLAHALGQMACRQGISTRFIRSQTMLRHLHTSRADLSWQQVFRQYIKPKLLILDDFALKSMTTEQAEDIYELVVERMHKGSFIITSNRTVDAWVPLFPDPVMANAILDRLANHAYQIILDGDSYRKKQRPQ